MKNKIWKWAAAACLFVLLFCRQMRGYAEVNADVDSPELFVDICDFDTGDSVEGSRLSVYRAEKQEGFFIRSGNAIEQWTTEGDAHRLANGLIFGETYLLAEEAAAVGRSPALPLLFTVNEDGSIGMVINGADHFGFFEAQEEGEVEAILSCRTAMDVLYQLLDDGRSVLSWQGNGREKEILPETAREGTWLTLCEQTRFSDGSIEHTGRTLFQVFYDKTGSLWLSERRPVKTVFCVRDEAGDVVECREKETGQEEHIRTEKISFSLSPGRRYCFEEAVCYDDGSSYPVSRIGAGISGDGRVSSLYLMSRETAVSITDRNEAPTERKKGKRLFLTNQEGGILESWEPGENSYEIKGRLAAGERYRITGSMEPDESAFDTGCQFRVLGDGVVTRIVFEKPVELETTDPEKELKIGRMTAYYDSPRRAGVPYLSGNIEQPSNEERMPGAEKASGKKAAGTGGASEVKETAETKEVAGSEGRGSWERRESREDVYRTEGKAEEQPFDVIYTSPVFTEGGESSLPDKEVERDGKRYRRFFLDIEEEQTAGETLFVSASTFYVLEGEEALPETAVVVIQDPVSGEKVEKELPRLTAEETGRTWIKNFSFPVTVNDYDAEYFTLGDMRLPSYSRLSNYGQEFLRFLGLPLGAYRIGEVEWDGGPYLEDGILKRNATARGERLVRNVTATYGGEMQMPDRTGKRYIAGYREITADTEETAEETDQTSIEDAERGEPEAEKEIEVQTEAGTGTEAAAGQDTGLDGPVKMPLYEKAVYQIKQAFYWVRRHFTVVHFDRLFFLVIALTAALLLLIHREEKRQKEKEQKQEKENAGARH